MYSSTAAATCAAPHSAGSLRRELNARAAERARRLGLRHEFTSGRTPSVIFGEDDQGCHGNFHPASYRAILANPEWQRRLGKAHTESRRAMPRADWCWRELDCAGSSDALLMNIFCHPAVFDDPNGRRLAALLGVDRQARPLFGVRPGVPLVGGLTDRTETDMKLGSLLVEAKLTESSFQAARPELVYRLRDLEEVFAVESLPHTRRQVVDARWDEEQAAMIAVERGTSGNFVSYQLIRGILAAYATGSSFCVLADSRRTDLLEAWHRIMRAVRSAELRCRLQVLTWQELAAAVPPELQHFLVEKYGIVPQRIAW